MSDDKKKESEKKDLTGILELSSLMPPASAEELLRDPFAVNEEQNVEQISDFESIDEIGMLDHVPEDEGLPENVLQLHEEAQLHPDPMLEISAPAEHEIPAHLAIDPEHDDLTDLNLAEPLTASNRPALDEIKNYSERALESTFQAFEKVPFHLWINGTFDPFSRDKLLLFITDNAIGLNSSDLDRQISADRVLLPRISEFAGIKLIQDLRDSGLSFRLELSSRDADETVPTAENLSISYTRSPDPDYDPAIPVLPEGSVDLQLWRAFDTIQLVQLFKAEIVEVERSEIFQDLMDRMLLSLKRKARLKGASAIGELKHELKPLRLPSQYQIELSATLYKK